MSEIPTLKHGDWWELEDRLIRLEQALRSLADEPGTPFAAAEKALKILDQETSDWTPEDGGYPKAGERGDILS